MILFFNLLFLNIYDKIPIIDGDNMNSNKTDKKDYLIALDLDGTLIQGLDNYDKISFAFLKELAKTNYIVIATGRPLRSSKYYYDLLELNTPIINYNGALVHNPNDSLFPKTVINVDRNMIIDIFNNNIDVIENIFCEIEDDIYLYKESKIAEKYLHQQGGRTFLGDINTTLKNNPNGAIVFSKHGSEKQLEAFIETNYKDILKIRFWDDEECVVSEIYNPLTTKANGLKKIIDYYQIPYEKTIAIGDGHNDIDMINLVKYGVAMGNSHPLLLNEAKYITKGVKENGVYHCLKKFFKK